MSPWLVRNTCQLSCFTQNPFLFPLWTVQNLQHPMLLLLNHIYSQFVTICFENLLLLLSPYCNSVFFSSSFCTIHSFYFYLILVKIYINWLFYYSKIDNKYLTGAFIYFYVFLLILINVKYSDSVSISVKIK